MRVGYYFHIPGVPQPDGSVLVPSFEGLFIQTLATQAGELVFYYHQGLPSGIEDFRLCEPSVRAVSLGPKRSGPARTFLPWPDLRRFRPRADGVDVMLIRGSSPLLPALVRACGDLPCALLLVADYGATRPTRANPRWRNALIALWARAYGRLQDRAARKALVLAKSPSRTRGTRGPYPNSRVVFTSTVTEEMLRLARDAARAHWTPQTGRTARARLVYTGRIVEDKGLFELLDAMRILLDRGLDVELEAVGWTWGDPAPGMLRDQAARLGLSDRLHLTGYVPAGPGLLQAYGRGHVFVLPTWTEGGVARSVTEAMAAGVPVVTTDIPAVRGILEDGRHAVLVQPHAPASLADGIARVLTDPTLRGRLVAEGRAAVAEYTLERSCGLILDHLRAACEAEAPTQAGTA